MKYTKKINFDVEESMEQFLDNISENHEISRAEYLRKIVRAQMPKEDVFNRIANVVKPEPC